MGVTREEIGAFGEERPNGCAALYALLVTGLGTPAGGLHEKNGHG